MGLKMDFLLQKMYTCKMCRWLTFQVYFPTRMHCSRMRTARLLPVSPSMHCYRGVSTRRGDTCPEGVPAHGGVPTQGRVWGYLPRGVYLPRKGCTCPGGWGVPAWEVNCPDPFPSVNPSVKTSKLPFGVFAA